jgi:hypothetical protein
MRLVPYAALLADIVKGQQRGRLLSEIGDALGSREIVRQTVLTWLSAPYEIERNGNKRNLPCTTASLKRTLHWHGERTAPESVP